MKQTILSTVDLARLIGVAEHRISYAHRCGKLAEPRQRLANKRGYTPSEVRRVAEYFNVTVPVKEDK